MSAIILKIIIAIVMVFEIALMVVAALLIVALFVLLREKLRHAKVEREFNEKYGPMMAEMRRERTGQLP